MNKYWDKQQKENEKWSHYLIPRPINYVRGVGSSRQKKDGTAVLLGQCVPNLRKINEDLPLALSYLIFLCLFPQFNCDDEQSLTCSSTKVHHDSLCPLNDCRLILSCRGFRTIFKEETTPPNRLLLSSDTGSLRQLQKDGLR